MDGSANDLYNPPTKTLLEVYPKYKATIKIETIRDIGVGKTSRPIKVTASNAPHTDISIDIKLSNSDATGITIQPHKLLITRGMTERYFLITIDAGFDVENSSY